MNRELTDITIVMDRSGSMATCRVESETGINRLIHDQASKPGEAVFSLVQFDTTYEFVHRAVPIKSVPHVSLVPRGGTALLDALGRAIVETGDRLSRMAEWTRPGLVVVVVVTDGEENSSKEFTKEKIREMVKHQEDVYKWQFMFLGANIDAFANAGSVGITSGVANYAACNATRAYEYTSGKLGAMRVGTAQGASFATVCSMKNFTDDEAKELMEQPQEQPPVSNGTAPGNGTCGGNP